MPRLERDGKIVITYTKGKPEIVLEGEINGRMIKTLPRHLMAAYRRLDYKLKGQGFKKKKKKRRRLN